MASAIQEARNNEKKILDLKKSGKSIVEICEKLGLSQSGVRNFLHQKNKNENTDKSASIARVNETKILQMKTEGKKNSQICQAIPGLTPNALKTVITRYNKENNIITPQHKEYRQQAKVVSVKVAPAKVSGGLPNFAINNGVLTIESTSDLKVSFDGKNYTFSL